MLTYSEWLGRYGIARIALLPSPYSVCFLSISQYISPSAETNETKRGLLCSWCQINIQCGRNSHWSCESWLPKTIKPWSQEFRLKWCCAEDHHHYHNLERPSLAERRQSGRPRSDSWADSALCWSTWGGGEGTALKQVGMFWHIKAADH